MKKVKSFSTNRQLQNSHGNGKCSAGNIVSNTVITLYGVRRVLDLSGDHFISYKCLSTMLNIRN